MARPVEKEITSIQYVITQKFKSGTVKLIGAAFGDQIDDRALCLPKLRAEAVALHTKLLNRVY